MEPDQFPCRILRIHTQVLVCGVSFRAGGPNQVPFRRSGDFTNPTRERLILGKGAPPFRLDSWPDTTLVCVSPLSSGRAVLAYPKGDQNLLLERNPCETTRLTGKGNVKSRQGESPMIEAV